MDGVNGRSRIARLWSDKKTMYWMLAVFLLGFIYYKINVFNHSWYLKNSHTPCKIPSKEMEDLLSLAEDTSKVLSSLGLTHFLVYGSLWGGLRYNGPLPWDNDFDYGILYHEVNKYTSQQIEEKFKEYKINCYYSYRGGFYRVTRKTARGDLMVFKDYYKNGWMHRIGIEAYIFFVNYRNFHRFPARLVDLPLDYSPFGGANISIPNDGLEIQKYHYPNDWWKIGKPQGCENA